MKLMTTTALFVALGLGALACSKDSDEVGINETSLVLEELAGLEVTVPKGTEVSKNAVGLGVIFKGTGVSMTLGPAIDIDAASLDEAKKKAEAYSPSNVSGEKLADGYILTYENKGSMGVNYWLVGRREVDGRNYTCGVTSPKKRHQESAIAICKSLRK